jgi:hypothetical protein
MRDPNGVLRLGPRFRILALGLMLWCGVSYAIAISQLQLAEPEYFQASAPAYNDALTYIRMVEGSESEPGPFRYRVVVPSVAAAIPDAVINALSARKRVVGSRAAAKLLLTNFVFLTLCGFAVWALLKQFAFSDTDALLGSLLFYASRIVVQYGGVPMVDAASWFFLAGAIAMLLAERYWAFAILVLIGMFVKETILLLIPFCALVPGRSRGFYVRAAVILTGVLGAYTIFRTNSTVAHSIVPSVSASITDLPSMLGYAEQDRMKRWFSLGGLLQLVSAFGPLWILAWLGRSAINHDRVLRRWLLVLPVMLMALFWTGANISRLLFLAFPVIVPLALVGALRLSGRQWVPANPATTGQSAAGASPSRLS